MSIVTEVSNPKLYNAIFENELSAKELFEKIGGNYTENKNRITIEFYDKYTDAYVYVEFWKDSKEFCFDINNFRRPELDLKLLLQAINKQVEELWGDEILKKNGNK